MRRVRLLLAFAALGVLVLGTRPSAASELSIWDWWNSHQPGTSTPSLDAPWTVASADDLWGDMTFDNVWTLPSGLDTGAFNLKIEFAGFVDRNTFGWYYNTLTNGSGSPVLNEVFTGPDSAGTVRSAVITLPAGLHEFGLYLKGPAGTFYSEDARNGSFRQLRTFQQVGGNPNLWAVCWEDEAIPSWDSAWPGFYAKSQLIDGGGAGNPLTWGDGPEPDYQDMILTMELVDPPNGTPELPAFVLLALSLAVLPVLRRKSRP